MPKQCYHITKKMLQVSSDNHDDSSLHSKLSVSDCNAPQTSKRLCQAAAVWQRKLIKTPLDQTRARC